MQTELFTLSTLFGSRLFRIPDYQRGYAWTEKQLLEFWNDITQLEAGRRHYTGVLTFESVPELVYRSWDEDLWAIEKRKFVPFYIVDGQQRLTTMLILLQGIIDVSGDRSLNETTKPDIVRDFIYREQPHSLLRSYAFGYEKDNPSYEYLKVSIFGHESTEHSLREETYYTKNLLAAKQFFGIRLQEMPFEQVESIYEKLTQRLVFNVYTIDAAIDVFVAFETMNNRGKPLSALELLKNRLIFLSTRLRTDGAEQERVRLRRTINECWKTIYHYLGRNPSAPIDDDEFLSLHFGIYFGSHVPDLIRNLLSGSGRVFDEENIDELYEFHHNSNAINTELLLEEIFSIRRLDLAIPGLEECLSFRLISEYAQSLKKYVKIYYEIYWPDDSALSDVDKILVERIRHIGHREAVRALLPVLMREQATDNRVKLFELIERYFFIASFTHHRMFQRNYLKIFKLEPVDIPAYATGRTTVIQLEDRIAAIVKEFGSLPRMTKSLELWAKPEHGGAYHWQGLRYFMFEYEQHLRSKTKSPRSKLIWSEFVSEDYAKDFGTVEHIYPQKADHSYWQSRFDRYSKEQLAVLRNSLGNLLPLSRARNAALSNRPFPEKIASGDRTTGYRFGCLTENELTSLDHWTPEEILARGLRLMKFIESHWGVEMGDDQTKIRMLGLDFMIIEAS